MHAGTTGPAAGGAAPPDATGLCWEALTAGYGGGPPVLGPVWGAARPGELVALLGPNGAGKTTLLRSALGQEVRYRGAIHLLGRRLGGAGGGVGTREARWRAQRLAYVPQAGGVRFGFTVAEVLAMARHAHGDAGGASGRSAIAAAAERCGVAGLMDRPHAALSGGQQRRVLLARGMAQADGGAVLLADEPTAGMDPAQAEAAMATLRAAATGGLAVVATLHDLTAAWRYADAVWLLAGGRLVARGTPEEVIQDAVLRPVYGTAFERAPGRPPPGAARGGAVFTAGLASADA
ncbi:ABC transporter ATP-binding protein [Phycisphaera mikurensis]|uniref:Putative ABC transporter ATP-binding protein n=1 Tax=Phycisphaera mikurensis (strain NBRC 102666 / KCTC 22515 / FYK2301M01) TaxID=1142394 RepID=I0IGU6_PHYMF|nr:ABC transporter ATP-binding protein [Phycisphaera mikurensis]MBB6440741.1 iron complex transport system ATP-binding protein [Phycisphaera mikurensis]BAM04484.1 putative ABC transporter ATP-binding protein [Phycisphaera mikurensis NBRC 102666]